MNQEMQVKRLESEKQELKEQLDLQHQGVEGGQGCQLPGQVSFPPVPGEPGGAVETRSPVAGSLCLTWRCLGCLAAWWAVDVQP